MATIIKSTLAQPATEGPDVCYLDGQFVAYANGQRIEGFANSQDAWNAARRAVFSCVTSDPSDATQAAYDAGFKAGKRATWQAVMDFCEQFKDGDDPPPAAPAIIITALPHICDDQVDTVCLGKQIWTDYRAGTDSKGYPTDVTIYEEITYAENNVPTLYAFGENGWPLDEVERVLPQIIALLNSPEVQVARQRWAELVVARQAMKQAT